MKLRDCWDYYERDKTLLGYSKNTLRAYHFQIKRLCKHLDDVELGNVTYEQLKGYLVTYSHLKPSSIGHRVRFIRSLFRWALDEGHISVNPATRLKEPKIGERIPKFLTEEEIEALREACGSFLEHALVEFMYTTGCRIGEIVQVNTDDIDWEKYSLIVNGKGNKQREVYFNARCKVWLRKYLDSRMDHDPALFVTERAPHRISVAQIRYVLKKIADRAGISERVYPHRLRHSYATHLLDNGSPMEAVQTLMGHEKSSTTAIYAKLSGERRREIYRKHF
jgi:integrase/recombinase XerD